MKKLLEAIQQNLQDALLEKVELLSDIDMEGNTDFNLPVKSVNKNVESEYIVASQNMKARLMAYLFDNKEDIAKLTSLMPILLVLVIIFGLIMLEPDFGTGFILILTICFIKEKIKY